MTPKEKAIELVNKFTFAHIYFIRGEEGAKMNAKFCANQCVDAILDTEIGDKLDKFKFWREVKKEIADL